MRKSATPLTVTIATGALLVSGALNTPALASSAGMLVDWQVIDSWKGGGTVAVTVTNHTSAPLQPWTVQLNGISTPSSVWNAVLSAGNTFQAPGWSPNLAPGQSATFGAVVSTTTMPTACIAAGAKCQVIGNQPQPTPTTAQPTPTPSTPQPTPTPTPPAAPERSTLPTPVDVHTTSHLSGGIAYHSKLPYRPGDAAVLALSDNYADLLLSNYVAGALMAHVIGEQNPELKINRDYVYGTLFAQLLQENIDTSTYRASSNWINPDPIDRDRLLASGQGGPYQINDYSKRLENEQGIGLINFGVLQKGLGYSIADQDKGTQTARSGPAALDQKYFGPMAAAYFHVNDLNRMAMNNAESWGPQAQHYQQCQANLQDPRSAAYGYNNFDLILNAAYNAGTYSRILGDYYRICAGQFDSTSAAGQAAAMGDYSLSDPQYQKAIGTQEARDSTFIIYPRQVRMYLDQLYNQHSFPSAAVTGDTVVQLSVRDIEQVFANSFGTLAYTSPSGRYDFISQQDAKAAFASARISQGIAATDSLSLTDTVQRAQFFDLLDAGIDQLTEDLGIDFGKVTETDLANPTRPSPTPTPAPDEGIVLSFVNASDWGSGRTVDAIVTNASPTATRNWTVTFGWPQDIAPWSGQRLSYHAGLVTVGNASWNGAIATGTSTGFGFSDASATMPHPNTCTATVNGVTTRCTIK